MGLFTIILTIAVIGVAIYILWNVWNDPQNSQQDKITTTIIIAVAGIFIGALTYLAIKCNGLLCFFG